MMGHRRKKTIATQNYEEFQILCALKPAEIILSKVQTHNFDVSKLANLEMEQSSSKATICVFLYFHFIDKLFVSFSTCSLRAIYGTDDQRNALHGSDSFSSAQREIRFFFPDCKFD